MLNVNIILGSTREDRAGEKIFSWLKKELSGYRDMQVTFIDLYDWQLPFLDDIRSLPIGSQREQVIQKWAEIIDKADGYIFVTPEYNHGYSAVLKNAIDHLDKEWNNKPAGFVGYGGVAGGSRAVEQLRQVVIELQMAPIREQVLIPLIWQAFDGEGNLLDKNAKKKLPEMLDQLLWWAKALQVARNKTPLNF